MLKQMPGEQLAIPTALRVAQRPRGSLEILDCFRPDRPGQLAWPAGALAFPQRGTAAGRKTMNPSLHGGGMLAQPRGHRGAGVPPAHQKHGVQPMVIPGFRRTEDFPPHGRRGRGRLGDLQRFHAPAG